MKVRLKNGLTLESFNYSRLIRFMEMDQGRKINWPRGTKQKCGDKIVREILDQFIGSGELNDYKTIAEVHLQLKEDEDRLISLDATKQGVQYLVANGYLHQEGNKYCVNQPFLSSFWQAYTTLLNSTQQITEVVV